MINQNKFASVWAVTDVPPQLGYPNGFSSRVHHFLKAVAERCSVDVLALHREGAEWTQDSFLPADFPVCHFWCEPLPSDPLNRPDIEGKLRRASHYLYDSLPYMSYPRQLPQWKKHWAEHAPDLAIFFLPYTAHLSFQLPTSVPRVYVLEEGWERSLNWATRHLPSALRWWITTTEGARVRRLYRRLASRGERMVVISDMEKEWFKQSIPEEQITTIPHGLDCEFFSPVTAEQDIDISVFGNYSTGRTSEEALDLYKFIESQPPELSTGINWAFIGKNPPGSLLALKSSQVIVTGLVTDFRPYYARTKVVAVPARYGTGVKTTVLEAWAMGRPVVATSFALNGLPARPGENVLVGDSPEELMRHIIALLNSPELRNRIGQSGLETVRSERNIRVLAKQFAEVCADSLSVKKAHP